MRIYQSSIYAEEVFSNSLEFILETFSFSPHDDRV